MLILTRRKGDDVVLHFGGATATVKVCGLRDGRVRLGVDAPRGILILRGECEPFGTEKTRWTPGLQKRRSDSDGK